MGRMSAKFIAGQPTRRFLYSRVDSASAILDVTMEGLDTDGNGVLSATLDSSVTTTSTGLIKEGGVWWQRTHVTEHGAGAAGNLEKTSYTRSKMNLGPDSHVEQMSVDGLVTITKRVVDAAAKTTKETIERGTSTVTATLAKETTNSIDATAPYDHKTVIKQGSTPATLTTTTHIMDALGRWKSTSRKLAATTTNVTSAVYALDSYGITTRRMASSTDSTAGPTSYYYDSSGRLIRTSSFGTVCYAYDGLGRITHQWGSGAYPVKYAFDQTGSLASMTTYSEANVSGFNSTSPVIPAAFSSAGDVTQWAYHPGNGALLGKTDAAGRAVTYLYDGGGRLQTRTWARGTTTTYSYDATGRLRQQAYSDGTPSVLYSYNRAGAVTSVTDASGTRAMQFTGALTTGETVGTLSVSRPAPTVVGGLLRQTFSVLSGGVSIYDTQRDSLLEGPLASVYSHGVQFNYDYDEAGRLSTLTPFTKATATATPVAIANAIQTRKYQAGGLLDKLLYGGAMTASTLPTTIYSGWNYSYDSAGRRIRVGSLGNSPVATLGTSAAVPTTAFRRAGWSYGYNARGEVISASRTQPTTSNTVDNTTALTVLGQSLGYNYDMLGNRLDATQGNTSSVASVTSYTPGTDPSTYGSITHPDVVEMSGLTGTGQKAGTRPVVSLSLPAGATASAAASEALGEATSYRNRMAITRSTLPTTAGLMALATTTTLDTSSRLNTARSWVYVPPQQEALAYDADGNLRSDGRWLYTWDGENQLVRMVERELAYNAPAGTNPPPRTMLEFVYDHQHRRSAKRVFRVTGNSGVPDSVASAVLLSHTLYLYEGWNLVAELDALNLNAPMRTYVWGSDLSGTMAGAGGVGGLLLVKHYQYSFHTTTYVKTNKSVRYLTHSDANGNVMSLLALEGTDINRLVGTFDYDPFGRRVVDTLPVGQEACPIGFSSKYEDRETGMLYYGYRYYSPEMGRWVNRDPIEESGGVNLYGMVGNDAVNRWDYLGLANITAGSADNIDTTISDFVNGGISNNWLFESSHPVSKRFESHKALKPIMDSYKALDKNLCDNGHSMLMSGTLHQRVSTQFTATISDFANDVATGLGYFGEGLGHGDHGINAFGSFHVLADLHLECCSQKKWLIITISNTWSMDSLLRNPITRKPFFNSTALNPVSVQVEINKHDDLY